MSEINERNVNERECRKKVIVKRLKEEGSGRERKKEGEERGEGIEGGREW